MKRLYFITLLTVSILLISILIGNSEILAQQTTITENVFVVIIDGLRNTEAFGDPTYQYIPNMGNILKPQGTLFNSVLNLGVTNTLPGHISILTGDWQQEPMYKGVKTRPLKPTIFEYYRKSKGLPQEQTWFVMGGKIEFLAYTDHSVHPLYGELYKAYISTPILQGDTYKDEDVFVELQRVMDTYHPSLVVVNFGNVDGAGHTGNWDYYTSRDSGC